MLNFFRNSAKRKKHRTVKIIEKVKDNQKPKDLIAQGRKINIGSVGTTYQKV